MRYTSNPRSKFRRALPSSDQQAPNANQTNRQPAKGRQGRQAGSIAFSPNDPWAQLEHMQPRSSAFVGPMHQTWFISQWAMRGRSIRIEQIPETMELFSQAVLLCGFRAEVGCCSRRKAHCALKVCKLLTALPRAHMHALKISAWLIPLTA